MPIYPWRVSSYAMDIYIFGNRTFAQIPEPYVEPVKEYAANTYRDDQLENAVEKGWITQQEYDETVAYRK